MNSKPVKIDVLCVGHACYDLVFSIDKHPEADEKIFANDFQCSGGGPAANAAIAISRLGGKAAFAGYLGKDFYGEKHLQELIEEGVDIQYVSRGSSPTPISSILVKPDGSRALINYKGATKPLPKGAIDFPSLKAKVILFDGHEPDISLEILDYARFHKIPTVLDAGSLHRGTQILWDKVDFLVASEKFACQLSGEVLSGLVSMAKKAPVVVITLGEKGLLWQRGEQTGELDAFPIKAIDTTGAGDAFHGAFAVALAAGMNWTDTLRFASAAGGLCCTKTGARHGLPWKQEVDILNA